MRDYTDLLPVDTEQKQVGNFLFSKINKEAHPVTLLLSGLHLISATILQELLSLFHDREEIKCCDLAMAIYLVSCRENLNAGLSGSKSCVPSSVPSLPSWTI